VTEESKKTRRRGDRTRGKRIFSEAAWKLETDLKNRRTGGSEGKRRLNPCMDGMLSDSLFLRFGGTSG